MKKWLFAILFGTALVLGACGGGDEGSSDESADTSNNQTEESADNGSEAGGTVDAAAAEEIFQSNCASCHGADLSGGAGPALTNVGSDYSKEEIADIIKNGKTGDVGTMPGGLVPAEDAELLASWLAQKK